MEEIDLKELFNIFWSRKIFIIITTIVFALIGILYSKYFIKPDYKAMSTLVLTKDASDEETITQTEVALNQKLVATYTELIRTNSVLRQVISNLQIDVTEEELRNNVNVTLVTNSQLIEISVTNEDPKIAQSLTNEITKVFIERVKEIYKMDNINIVDEAKVPNLPYNINHKKNLLMFAAVGLMLSGGIAFALSLFDTTIKNAEEAEKRLNLNVLASIPNYNYDTKKKGKK